MKDTYKDIKNSFSVEEMDSDEDSFRKQTIVSKEKLVKDKEEIQPEKPADSDEEDNDIMVEVGKDEVRNSLGESLLNDKKN